MPMKIPYNNEKGMTLLELLLAMTILMIVITVFFQFFSQSASFNNKNEKKLKAINLARETISEIKESTNIDQFINGETIKKDNKCGHGNGDLINKTEGEFHISICFEEGPEKLKKVTVLVQHQTDKQSNSETYTYIKRDESDG